MECTPKKTDNCEEPPFLIENWNSALFPAITEMCVKAHHGIIPKDDDKDRVNAFFTDFVKTYMDGDPWIPYDMEERRKKFPKAFEELKYYINRILADREKERGAR